MLFEDGGATRVDRPTALQQQTDARQDGPSARNYNLPINFAGIFKDGATLWKNEVGDDEGTVHEPPGKNDELACKVMLSRTHRYMES